MTELMEHSKWASHGVCWLWDPRVIALHSVPDITTFLAYAVISLTGLYVFRWSQRTGVHVLYPRLWLLGIAFVGTCSLSHLGNTLEIFIGDWMYWVTGANKVVMATVSTAFAVELWRTRNVIVDVFTIVGRIRAATVTGTQTQAQPKQGEGE